MLRSNPTIFQVLTQRALLGKRFDSSSSIRALDQAADEAIKIIFTPAQVEVMSQQLKVIKNLAQMGSKIALDFYKGAFENFTPREELGADTLLHLKEIAYHTSDAELLYHIYLIQTSKFSNLLDINIIPSFSDGMKALIQAATSKGVYATKASYTLALLYADSIRESTIRLSINDLYNKFINNMIDLDMNQLVIAHLNIAKDFAKSGCSLAMIDLNNLYQHGNAELNIAPDLCLSDKWQEILRNNEVFLREQFLKYFEIALSNTIKFGWCNEEIFSLIDTYGLVIHGDEYDRLALYNSIKTRFVAAANKGNIQAAQFMGLLDLKGLDGVLAPNATEAKKWFQVILDSNAPTCPIVIDAARKLYNLSTEESPIQRRHLLVTASKLGCPRSAFELGEEALTSGDFTTATSYFNLALIRSKNNSIPVFIYALLKKYIDLENPEHLTFFIKVAGEAVRNSATNIIPEIVSLLVPLKKQTLIDMWNNEARLIWRVKFNADELNFLIEETTEILLDALQEKIMSQQHVKNFK